MDKNVNKSIKPVTHSNTGLFYKIFKLFTEIRPGEEAVTFLLMLNIFLIFTAYYIIKPVREALILAGKGVEFKSYLSAVMVVLLIFVVKAYSAISSRVSRQKLISWVTIFFISNLVIFYVFSLLGIGLGTMGIIFFVWIGIFNLMVPAQFWGFANDIFTPEAGKRLLPIVAFGATFGAFSGSTIARWLVTSLGVYQMMLFSAGILVLCIFLSLIVHRIDLKKNPFRASGAEPAAVTNEHEKEKPLDKTGGFKLIFKKRYLLYIALFVLFLNFVNTNGEYMLGDIASLWANNTVNAGTAAGLSLDQMIGKFYAEFFQVVNFLTLFIQLVLVSRIFKWFGVRIAVLILPIIALGGYSLIGIGATLAIIKWTKILENSTDYSLMNTTRHALFLVTTREEKYKAKAAVATFFHRAGDILSALIVYLGIHHLAFNLEKFGLFNVALVAVMLVFGFIIMREHKRITAKNSIANP
ncbi:MAG: hypothetical protein JXB26_02065 [Candidatus Aminicenantes bacterium]|nr:hypothetical protein [Candidatus Aminicenantes bacterium]